MDEVIWVYNAPGGDLRPSPIAVGWQCDRHGQEAHDCGNNVLPGTGRGMRHSARIGDSMTGCPGRGQVLMEWSARIGGVFAD